MEFQSKTIQSGGETFTVTELSARQRKEALKLYNDKTDPIDLQAHYIKMSVLEMKDKTPDQILDIPGSVFGELVDAIMEISGLSEKAVKDAEKNS